MQMTTLWLLSLCKLQCNAEVCVTWCDSNMMMTNPQKFQFMLLSPECSLDLPDTHLIIVSPMTKVTEVKLLGITIDTKVVL